MAEPASPPMSDPASVPLRARVEPSLLATLDRMATRASKPGAPVTRSDVLRALLYEALATRGEPVAA